MQTVTRVAVGGTLVVAGVIVAIIVLSDEAPIRVRNGSVNFEAEHGINPSANYGWKPEDGDADENVASYSHEPGSFNVEVGKTLYVRVDASTGCNMTRGSGNLVTITHKNGTEFKMRRSRSGVINQRTKLRPKNLLQLDSTGAILTYPSDGYVTKVTVGSLSCTFPTREALNTIFVCASEKRCNP